MEKLTKKNSILYNQLWINVLIEEGYLELLPFYKPTNKSIGEYIEQRYNELPQQNQTKITKHNSLLFEIEWVNKYLEEGLHIPKYLPTNYSKGEVLELRYFERELLKYKPHTEDILLLPHEKVLRKND